MKVLLLGDTSAVLDEGAKNVASCLSQQLAVRHEVHQVHQREVLRPSRLRTVLRFAPEVVISVQGPSAKTIFLLAVLRCLMPRVRVLVVGAQPSTGRWLARVLRWLPPDVAFAQSSRWLDFFQHCGVPVTRLPNGVSLQKFHDRHPDEQRLALRRELGLAENDLVALHIGPLNANRNHEVLIQLRQQTPWKVVVVGSTTAPYVSEVQDRLVAAGVVVARRYFEDISLLYAMADVYVFPVTDPQGSIEFPLTVLEAMACDRPVVTTAFLAVPEYLQQGPALQYFDGGLAQLSQALQRVAGKGGNRERAAEFDWDHVVRRVEVAFLAAAAMPAGLRK